MALSVSEMREVVSSLYPGSWPDRVANMKANQVQAIFYKNFNYDGSPKPKQLNKKDKKHANAYQITVWDILNMKAGALYEENNTSNI